MKLISIKLYSKNNKKTGIYVYCGVALDEATGKYYHATLPIQKQPLKLSDVKQFSASREISTEYYSANGIK